MSKHDWLSMIFRTTLQKKKKRVYNFNGNGGKNTDDFQYSIQ